MITKTVEFQDGWDFFFSKLLKLTDAQNLRGELKLSAGRKMHN